MNNIYKNISFKNIIRTVDIVILSNYAKIGPPLSIVLSFYKIKPIQFCDDFNKKTKNKYLNKLPLRVTIYLYNNKSFKYITKYPSLSFLIKNLLKYYKKNTLTYLDIYKLSLIKKLDDNNILINSIFKNVISTVFSMNIKIINK